jgi:hypothetical protein
LFYPFLNIKYSPGPEINQAGLTDRNVSLKKIIYCLKLYLGFEHWVHKSHTINEVSNAHNLVGKLIETIKDCFPCDDERGKGWGWTLPKMHAFANMPQNMLKFLGTARIFSGQIGKQSLKAILIINLWNNMPLENVRHGNLTSTSRMFPFSLVLTERKSG